LYKQREQKMGFPVSYLQRKELYAFDSAEKFADIFFVNIIERISATEFITHQRTGTSLAFRGPISRYAWNGWNFLNGITKGKLHIEQTNQKIYLKQELYFTEFFVIALIFSILPIALSYNWVLSMVATILVWFVFYGGSCLISIIRFNSFLNKTIEKMYKEMTDY